MQPVRRLFSPVTPPGAGRGFGRERVIGPVMLWITAPQFGSDLMVGRSPETLEIVGDLLRPAVRGKEVHLDPNPAAGDGRALGHTEEFLNLDRERGRLPGFVLEPNAAAARDPKTFRRLSIERGRLRSAQAAGKDTGDGQLPELRK
jgi:hypothetical protein